MKKVNDRPLVIYHGNCADGFSAAWCFWRKYKDNADYVAGVYSQNPPDVTNRNVYLVDFSYRREVVQNMLSKAKEITLIDHHKTAIEDLIQLTSDIGQGYKPLGWFCDMNRSGATLAWDYLFPEESRPLLLGHIEDRDLWRFKLPGTREIQSFVYSYEYTFEHWDKLMSADQVDLLKMTASGAAIERKHHKDIAELLSVCKRYMVIGGYRVPVASLPYTMSSDAASIMAHNEHFAACYIDTELGRTFSLRSVDGGLDVSEIAKQYGGGGHVRAAGFTISRSHILAQT